MREGTAPLIRREDYAAPAYWIRTVELTLDLDPAKTLVVNRMQIERNPAVETQALRLDGDDLNLTRVLVNGESVSFRVEGQQLVLDNLPDGTSLHAGDRTTCAPEKNTQLSGLYTSSGGFFTQCEAEGFRRITYFLDRPDVMAVYTVTLQRRQGEVPGAAVQRQPGRARRSRRTASHFAKWHDPFPKPSYLFAAGGGPSWCAASRRSARAPARSTCCRSMCAPATSTRPSTR